ncbi:MAG TPA: hypothetical protein VG222_05325 [Vicinamibacterales bacterium]|nr:hypothetical protein [Vicinamibacterales bacterium]
MRPTAFATVERFVLAGTLLTVAGGLGVSADDHVHFLPDNLVVSRSVYDNNPNNVGVGMVLPPDCASTTAGCPKKGGRATADGSLPLVWNNDLADPSFGITSKIFLDQVTPDGTFVNTLEVPNSSLPGVSASDDQLVTSFSSKSELALNLSTDKRHLTFMGYVAPIDTIDASNSNTPLVQDPTNPVGETFLRAAAAVDQHGRFWFTETNAYSGNNGRAAILNDHDGAHVLYLAGNAGNGGNPQPDGIIIGAGAQILTSTHEHESAQVPGLPTPVASFNVTQVGLPLDKVGKDTNFRGLTVFNQVLYLTKGSGSNGINTVYFVDTTGLACPATSATPGVGVPLPNATLPTAPLAYDPSHTVLQASGLVPTNMCVLAGFPTLLARSTTGVTNPFGLWFADDHTLYLADEGDGATGTTPATFYGPAASQPAAGLQKWVFDDSTKQWTLAYTLQAGLDLGTPYTVPTYPTGNNPGTGLPWAPATDGLRNLTGRVERDGTVTIWAITSTVSGNGDQGADPNKLVRITDRLSARTAGTAQFVTLRTASNGEVLRGVSFTPTDDGGHANNSQDR